MTAPARRAALLALALGCAHALREPAPLPAAAPHEGGAAALLREADAAWARRADPEQARAAQELYTEAASADPSAVQGLLGAMRAAAFRIEREREASRREKLAGEAVQLGQWCQRRAPSSPACAYRLAIALGQAARDRTSIAKDALGKMVSLLRAAIVGDPRMDHAGPHRVLALVLLKAPGWPIGPGDPDEALREARNAEALFPEWAENQLALGDALAKTGHDAEARAAYEKAAAIAQQEEAAGEPDAVRWREEAKAALAKGGRA